MKRTLALAAATGFAAASVGLALTTVPATSQGPPEHPHMMLLDLQFDEEGEPTGYRRCIDLANGQKLPLHAHHNNVHVGTAGENLRGKAGNFVVPGPPLTPWNNCAELAADLGFD